MQSLQQTLTIVALVIAAALVFWFTRSQVTEPMPQRSCRPRPPCLDATPPCLMPEPPEGWCPAL